MARKKKGLFKKIGKKIGSGIKNIAKETGKAIKNPVKAIKNLAKGIVKVGSFTALLPFKRTMENHLKRKGIATNGKIDDIAVKFADSVKRKKNYESLTGTGTRIKDDGVTCYYGKCGTGKCWNKEHTSCSFESAYYESFESMEGENISTEVITEVVRFVVDFFKQMKEKKEKGEADSEELAIANDVATDEKAIETEVEKGAKEGTGSGSKIDFSDMSKMLPIVLIVIALIFVMKKKG